MTTLVLWWALLAPDKPVALLVVLHGDDAGADSVTADFRRAAARANVALFTPDCPRELGCEGSWWRWQLTPRHDPAWLEAQILAAASRAHTERVILAGYSGGASYLAGWAPSHPKLAHRVAFVSGGYPATDVCPAAPFEALFFIGDDDPMLDEYVRPLAAWLTTCDQAHLTWRLLPHVGHKDMHRALRDGRADDVIGWLLAP